MSAQPNIQGEISTSSSRLCWVLNRDLVSYKGTCGGVKVEIPPEMQKIPKRYTEGGNLFGYLEAVDFVRSLKEPQGFKMDEAGKPHPIFGPKALFEKELTPEEFATIVGKKPDELKREAIKEEKKARKKLTEEINKYPKRKVEVQEEDE